MPADNDIVKFRHRKEKKRKYSDAQVSIPYVQSHSTTCTKVAGVVCHNGNTGKGVQDFQKAKPKIHNSENSSEQ